MEILAEFVPKSRNKLFSRIQHAKLPDYIWTNADLLLTAFFSPMSLSFLLSSFVHSLLYCCRNLSTGAKCLTLLFQDHKTTLLPSIRVQKSSLCCIFLPVKDICSTWRGCRLGRQKLCLILRGFSDCRHCYDLWKSIFSRLQACTEDFSIVLICFTWSRILFVESISEHK